MKKYVYKTLLLLMFLTLIFSFLACTNSKSAYDIWLGQGNTGTEADFLDWLKGATGENGSGENGLSAYEIYKKYHSTYTGSEAQWIDDLINGRLATSAKAYQVEYLAGTGGTILGNTKQTVKLGGDTDKVMAVCYPGYIFDKWADGVETLERQDKNITIMTTVTALFKESPLLFSFNDSEYRVRIASDLKDITQQIIIPSHYGGYPVTEIADAGFMNCPELRLVVLPETLTKIGINAFFNCVNLQTAYMPDIERIETGAFGNCVRLQHIYIPSSLMITGDSLFKRPVSADSLTVYIECSEESTESWSDKWKNGCPDIEIRYNNYYTDYADLQFRSTDENTETLYVSAATNSLTELHLPPVYNDKLIEEIKSTGFSVCQQLREVVLPASIKKINNQAFANCRELETIYLATVEYIGNSAFALCRKLDNIIIPLSVNYMGQSVFLLSDYFEQDKPLTIYIEAREEDISDWNEQWITGILDFIIIYDYRNA